ncbi:sigma factor-like helix-turn-helix DNA-binding protein [Mycobacteroides abscessus]
MTTYTSAASQPATELINSARQLLATRRNNPSVQNWLTHLGLSSPEELLSPSRAADWNAVLSLLLAEHRAKNSLATATLLAGQARTIANISRWADGSSVQERFNTTVEAFLSHALTRAPLSHPYLGEQLYWITLRAVSRNLYAREVDAAPLPMVLEDRRELDLEDKHELVCLDDYLTVDSILGWAQSQKVLTDADAQVLKLRFGHEKCVPVRQIAADLGVSENALESRLRRILGRLRNHVLSNMSAFEHACLSRSHQMPVSAAAASDREQIAA